jgi:hypothetical protein
MSPPPQTIYQQRKVQSELPTAKDRKMTTDDAHVGRRPEDILEINMVDSSKHIYFAIFVYKFGRFLMASFYKDYRCSNVVASRVSPIMEPIPFLPWPPFIVSIDIITHRRYIRNLTKVYKSSNNALSFKFKLSNVNCTFPLLQPATH